MGIRGATVGEILQLLPALARRSALWYGKLSRRHAALKKAAWALLIRKA